MTQTVTISDGIYTQLQQVAQVDQLENIDSVLEKLLESWAVLQQQLEQRQQTVYKINNLRDRLQDNYGTMPDSVALIRDDRER